MLMGMYVPPDPVVDGGMQEGYCIRGFNVKIIGNRKFLFTDTLVG
jgi:hypothetical protein